MKQEYEEYFNTFKQGCIIGALMVIIAILLCLSLLGAVLIVIGLLEWISYKALLGVVMICICFPLFIGGIAVISEQR